MANKTISEARVAKLEKQVAALVKVLRENGLSLDHHKDIA